MLRSFGSRLSYANVMATVAVFLALGGGAYAALKLPRNSVGARQIKPGAITNTKLANGAVTGGKVAPNTLTGTQIVASTLGLVPTATHASVADSAATLNGNAIRWAVVDASGVIAAQSGGFTVTFHASAGTILNSTQPVTGHAIVVSNGVAGGDGAARGAPIAGPCGTGSDSFSGCTVIEPDANDGHHVLVTTQSTTGVDEPHSFYIMIY